MRNVNRPPMPESLRLHGETWTKELMDAVARHKGDGTPISSSLQEKYKQADVLAALKIMYSAGDGRYYCCYCEGYIADVSYPHIEHRKPKAIEMFPELTFDWYNLHLSCGRCNTHKGNKWDPANEILDAAKDPIVPHLGYRLENINGVYRERLTDRGHITVEHADLDRESLRIPRLETLSIALAGIQDIMKSKSNALKATKIKILRDRCSGEYGSVIAWALETFLSA